MLRALLASIFALLAASVVVAAERAPTPAMGKGQFAGTFAPRTAPQGHDQIDVDKQPCFTVRHGAGKAAIDTEASPPDRHSAQAAGGNNPPRRFYPGHTLFLYACPPRAPPAATAA